MAWHYPEVENYIVGYDMGDDELDESDDVEFRNFFTFDMSSFGEITSATLRLWLPDDDPDTPDYQEDGYKSPDEYETYDLYEVTTSTASLKDGTAGTDAFNDLKDGEFYGAVEVYSDEEGSFVEVVLNDMALTDMSAADGLWAIGGAIAWFDHAGIDEEKLFRWTDAGDSPVELVVEAAVPLPAGVLLLGSGLIGLLMTRRESVM